MTKSTLDYLAEHAQTRPDDLAVYDRGEKASFRKFYEDVRRTAVALERLDLIAGDIVVIEYDGLYRSWLLHLACEALCVATSHFATEKHFGEISSLVQHSALVVHNLIPVTGALPTLLADDAWWTALLDEPVPASFPYRQPNPDTIVRIATSSGTTGTTKFIPLTAANFEERLRLYDFRLDFGPHTRHLLSIGFGMQAAHIHATMCLRAGGICFHVGESTVDRAIAEVRPNHIMFLPVFLPSLMALGENAQAVRDIAISITGGRVPTEMRRSLEKELGYRFIESYATNEASAISDIDINGLGTILPGFEVEVVDDLDRNLPFSEIGYIRVKGPAVTPAYLFEDGATQRMYRDGWFYPGDLGSIPAPGKLKLLGRGDDLVNIFGIKHNALDIEHNLNSLSGINDSAIVVGTKEDGTDMLWVGLVLSDGADLQSLQDQITEALPENIGATWMCEISHVPRTETGKIRRDLLKTNFETHFKQS